MKTPLQRMGVQLFRLVILGILWLLIGSFWLVLVLSVMSIR